VAKLCRSIILQNFYGTLIVDTIRIGLAAAGPAISTRWMNVNSDAT